MACVDVEDWRTLTGAAVDLSAVEAEIRVLEWALDGAADFQLDTSVEFTD